MIKVILLTDIPKVGNKYDVKEFKEGYAQNVLLSKGLAILATKSELAKLEDRKIHAKKKKDEEMKIFDSIISTIDNKKIEIKAKANDKGHLFKSVSPTDITQAIKEISGVEIDKDSIVMNHIKEIGSHFIEIKKGDRKGKCEVLVIKS